MDTTATSTLASPQTPEQRAKRWGLIAKVAVFTIVGLVAAPVVGLAITGLVGLLIAGIIGLGTLAILPWVEMKAANWRLKLIKAEAAKNPVETLQNEYRRQQEKLVTVKEAIKVFDTKIRTFEGKLDGFKSTYPSEAPRYDEQLAQMKKLLALRQARWREAAHNLELFDAEIRKADAIWQMGQAAAEAGKGLGMSDDDFYAAIKVQTSMDAVQNSLNSAFADLDTLLMASNEPKGLPVVLTKSLPAATAIEIEPAKLSTKVHG